MSKILLRFLVTIVILAATVLGVWLIWFKPSRELEVFNILTEVQNDKQVAFRAANGNDKIGGNENINNSLTIKQENTDKVDYYSLDDVTLNEDTRKVQSPFYGKIAYLRGYMFGFKKYVTDTNSVDITPFKNIEVDNAAVTNAYASFEEIYNQVDAAFKYYYSYVQLAEDVSRDDAKEVEELAEKLNAEYSSYVSNANEILTIIKEYSNINQTTVLSETAALYANLAQDYYDIIKCYTDLTLDVRNYVVEYVFDGKVAFDTKTVSYELVLNTVKQATSVPFVAYLGVDPAAEDASTVDTFADYLASAGAIINAVKTNKVEAVVKDYATLANNYADGLIGEHGLFKLSLKVKKDVKDGTAQTNSYYNETYLNNVKALAGLYFA